MLKENQKVFEIIKHKKKKVYKRLIAYGELWDPKDKWKAVNIYEAKKNVMNFLTKKFMGT